MPAITHGEVSPFLFRLGPNLTRGIATEMATPFYYANRIIEVVIGIIEAGGIEAFMFRNRDADEFRLSLRQNHEDFAGNPIHLFLIALCGAVLIGKVRRGHVSVIHYFALALFAAYLAFFLFLRWNIWITRLHLPLFAMGASVIAVSLNGSFLARARTSIVVLIVVASQLEAAPVV